MPISKQRIKDKNGSKNSLLKIHKMKKDLLALYQELNADQIYHLTDAEMGFLHLLNNSILDYELDTKNKGY